MLTETIDVRNLAGAVGCGLIVGVIPVVGAFFMLGLGIAGMTMGSRKLRQAKRLLGEEMAASLTKAEIGDEVRIQGRVASGGEIRAPLTGNVGVLAEVRVLSRRVNGFFSEQWHEVGATPFAVVTDEGTVEVDASRGRLTAWRMSKRNWTGEVPEEIANALGEIAKHLDTTYREDGRDHDLELEFAENWLLVGDEVTVQGRVEARRTGKAPGAGYRDQAVELRVTLTATDVTSLSDERLRKRRRKGNTELALGVCFMVIAIINGAFSAQWLL